MITRDVRVGMARAIMDHAREVYEAEGTEGDFEDGERYLRDDASDAELQAEFDKLPGGKNAT